MADKLFGQTNFNGFIFTIPKQEGADLLDDDQRVASIGDATMQHIQDMCGTDRLVFNEYLHMPDGNLYVIEDQPRWHDPDEYNLGDKTDLEIYMKRNKIPEKERHYYEDAVIQEMERRMQDDALGHKDELVSYDNWQKFPQQWAKWDIPTTPRPRLRHVGNARKMFYDSFSGDVIIDPDNNMHPLEKEVIKVLNTLNNFEWQNIMTDEQIRIHNADEENCDFQITQIEEDEWVSEERNGEIVKAKVPRNAPEYLFTDGIQEILHVEMYTKRVYRILFPKRKKIAPPYTSDELGMRIDTYKNLKMMLLELSEKSNRYPIDIAEYYLAQIDRYEFKQYVDVVRRRTRLEDPLYTYIAVQGRRLVAMAKDGEQVYSNIKKMGSNLYKNGLIAERLITKEKNAEGKWVVLKDPRTEVTCQRMRKYHWQKYHQIKAEIFRIEQDKAQRKITAASEEVKQWVNAIVQAADNAINERNLKLLTKYAAMLIHGHRSKSIVLEEEEWKLMWDVYNEQKNIVLSNLSNQSKEKDGKRRLKRSTG